jgi:hypothetical protein
VNVTTSCSPFGLPPLSLAYLMSSLMTAVKTRTQLDRACRVKASSREPCRILRAPFAPFVGHVVCCDAPRG